MTTQLMCAALLAAAAFAAPAHATSVALAADGAWNEFTVDDLAAPAFGNGWIDFMDGSPLSYTFTIASGHVGRLTVVDAGYAGDTFTVTDFGTTLGTTSAVAPGTTDGAVTFDFDAALQDPAYSRGVFTFGAGSHRIDGRLAQSVLDAGVALDATDGAVRLQVSAVPESPAAAMLLAGLGVVGLLARRRQRGTTL